MHEREYPIVPGWLYNDEDQLDACLMWCDLGLMRKLGREAGIPLWFYYQGVNLHHYPHFEFPMVECMMNAAVLYGVKGLQQFTAVGNVIDENGDKGPFFEETKAVHAKFRKLGNTLMALENRYVFHSGEIAEKCPLYAPFSDNIADSAVLADVPCSGLGVIRKRPEIRRKEEAELAELPLIQRSLLENLSSLVKPGGVLLYSTCTVLSSENDAVIDSFLQTHPDYIAEDFQVGDFVSHKGRYSFWPQTDGTDGFFAAKLRRKTI